MVKLGGKVWENPEPGRYDAICCDVVYRGWRRNRYETEKVSYRNEVLFTYQLAELMSDGKPFLISTKPLNLTFGKGSNLAPFIGSWRARLITPQELHDKIELDDFIGKQCELSIIQQLGENGSMQARINAIMPPGRMAPKLVIRDYVKVRDRLAEDVSDWLMWKDERPKGAVSRGSPEQDAEDTLDRIKRSGTMESGPGGMAQDYDDDRNVETPF